MERIKPPHQVIEKQNDKNIRLLGTYGRQILKRSPVLREVMDGNTQSGIVEMTTCAVYIRMKSGGLDLQTVRENDGIVTVRKIIITDFHDVPLSRRFGKRSVSYREYKLNNPGQPLTPQKTFPEKDTGAAIEKTYIELGKIEEARILDQKREHPQT